MVFNVSVGLQGLENPDSEDELGKKYALYLADTVVVKERGEAEVISDVPKGFQDIAYFFKDENEDKQDEAAKAAKAPAVVRAIFHNNRHNYCNSNSTNNEYCSNSNNKHKTQTTTTVTTTAPPSATTSMGHDEVEKSD